MESHVMNSYHRARYQLHDVNRVASSSECSSDSSVNHNSPEYPQRNYALGNVYTHKDSLYAQRRITDANNEWKTNIKQEIKVEVSSDEENNDSSDSSSESDGETQEQNNETPEHFYTQEQLVANSDVDYEYIVDNEQYLEVYAIDPNACMSEDDDEKDDYCIQSCNDDAEVGDDTQTDDDSEDNTEDNTFTSGVVQGNVNHENSNNMNNYNLDSHVVSDIDEYFVKPNKSKTNSNDKKLIIVDNTSKYFLKNNKQIGHVVSNVDEYFVKNSSKSTKNKKLTDHGVDVIKSNGSIIQQSTLTESVSQIPRTDTEVLPHIENIKRFLLEDMPGTKSVTKSVQRSCSLPHSPAHMPFLDLNDGRTSLSFEDLNITELDEFSLVADSKNTDRNFDLSSLINKSDDTPRTLTEEDVNGFFVSPKIKRNSESKNATDPNIEGDDLSQQDMEIECPLETKIQYPSPVVKVKTEHANEKISLKKKLVPPNVLDFCIEKGNTDKLTEAHIDIQDIKIEPDDFVDVESFTDNAVLPVLEANNLNSLLEQFEANENLNKTVKVSKRSQSVEDNTQNEKKNGLANGTRLQDAAVQLNKAKLRHIMISSSTPKNAASVKADQTVHSDHDYCSPKKRHSISIPTNIKGGQSLLKPEVLSSNNKILRSRHRTCKDKKIVYNISSDEETNVNSKKSKPTVKANVKTELHSNHRKKLSPVHSVSSISTNDKSVNSVMSNHASKASDNDSQSSSGSIKLTIKNKSKVILNLDCDDKKDSHTNVNNSGNDKVKSIDKRLYNVGRHKNEKPRIIDRSKCDNLTKDRPVDNKSKKVVSNVKQKDFYTGLFNSKQSTQFPQSITKVKVRDKLVENEDKNTDQYDAIDKPLKKKLNLKEYKLRKEGNSNASSRTVSPEAIFPDVFDKNTIEKAALKPIPSAQKSSELAKTDEPEKIFDPISEASRKMVLNAQKQMAKRQAYDEIVMTKIPKVDSLELQPLISDAEMMKMVNKGMISKESLPVSVQVQERPKVKDPNYEEIVMVSIGTNTDKSIFTDLANKVEKPRAREQSPNCVKSAINFKIKKVDNVLKQNVFDPKKFRNDTRTESKNERQSSPHRNGKETKIDKERYKDIAATIKSVEKKVDAKISSNSLFASIQDVVMKKAPDDQNDVIRDDNKKRRSYSPVERRQIPAGHVRRKINTTIIRKYDPKIDHGEDKIILHLEKNRIKPVFSSAVVQTEASDEFGNIVYLDASVSSKSVEISDSRKRTGSDSSMCSGTSKKSDEKLDSQSKNQRKSNEIRRGSSRRSRSRDRYDVSRRSRRTRSRSRRSWRRSYSRSKSRSLDRYRRSYYRRSDSPFRRNRSRSPYRFSRRDRSRSRRSYRPRPRSRSRSRRIDRSRSPMLTKLKVSQEKKENIDVRRDDNVKLADSASLTPPLRKPTTSECSDSSVSSSNSSSSSSSSSSDNSGSSRSSQQSRSSMKNRRSLSPGYRNVKRKPDLYRIYSGSKRSYSSEDRECQTPVEERRIVFVGKLEKDVNKTTLRGLFSQFGHISEVTLHTKEDGTRYGFVTYQNSRDAWTAVSAAETFPKYDVGFGGRRAFCRHRYADLDGIETDYMESAYLCQPAAQAPRHDEDMSFEQMLHDMKQKLSQRKNDMKNNDTKA